MKPILQSWSYGVLLLAAFALSGCATLSVTPLQDIPATATKQPASIGIQVTGERLLEALNDPAESAATAASGKLFNKVTVLPPDAQGKTPAELLSRYGVDYVMTTTLNDVNIHGDLNPIWFISIPLVFFKPLAPIVTFESVVTLDSTVQDTHSGAVILKRQVSAVTTDHFSPINPQAKVRKLAARAINNAFVDLLTETKLKVAK